MNAKEADIRADEQRSCIDTRQGRRPNLRAMNQTCKDFTWHSVDQNFLEQIFAGCASLEKTNDGFRGWRIDIRDRDFIHPDLQGRASAASGIHLRFRTDASALRLQFRQFLDRKDDVQGIFEILVDGNLVERRIFPIEQASTWETDPLPSGWKTVEVFFPTTTSVAVSSLELGGSSAIELAPSRPKWITHGSSITHCRAAEGPSLTWPAIVAREKQWDAWNFGYGGQCKIEQIIARMIARFPADRISLCLGINTSHGFYCERTWISAVEGFLFTVRDGHPDTPLLVISPILSPPREEFDNPPCVLGLKNMRLWLQEIVEKFRNRGDRNIYYMSGLEIIGPGDEATMPDNLHPDAGGIKLMGRRFLDRAPAAWAS
jgi:hypothetical protein